MDKKILHLLWASLIWLLALCIGVFVLMVQIMLRENNDALSAVVVPYMEGIGTQVQYHFETLFRMRTLQVENILNAIPPEETDQITEEEQERFEKLGRNVEFEYLALYNTEGEAHLWGAAETGQPGFLFRFAEQRRKDVGYRKESRRRSLYALWRFSGLPE